MEKQTQLFTSLTRYLTSLIGRNLSEHTSTAYRTDLLQFLTWLAENDVTVDSPKKITRTHILDYLSHLVQMGVNAFQLGWKGMGERDAVLRNRSSWMTCYTQRYPRAM